MPLGHELDYLTVAGMLGSLGGLRGLALLVIDPSVPIPVAMFAFPRLPENYGELHNYLTNIQPTFGGGFADKYGEGPGQITLVGVFPKTRSYAVDWITSMKPVNDAGMVSYLRYVCRLAAGSDRAGRAYRVVLMNWVTHEHWQIEIKNLRLSMSTGRNTVWVYNLAIEVLSPLTTPIREAGMRVLDNVVGAQAAALLESGLNGFLSSFLGG